MGEIISQHAVIHGQKSQLNSPSLSSQGYEDKESHTSHRTRERFPVSSSLDASWLYFMANPGHVFLTPLLLLSPLSSCLEGQMGRCRQEGFAASKEEGVLKDKGKILQFWWKQEAGNKQIRCTRSPEKWQRRGKEEVAPNFFLLSGIYARKHQPRNCGGTLTNLPKLCLRCWLRLSLQKPLVFMIWRCFQQAMKY